MTILVIIAAIGLQVFLTYKKLSPFLSLLIVAILAGLCLGMEPTALLKSVETGVGSTLGSLALIICLGAALGKILEVSGAAEAISTTLIKSLGEKNIQWAVLLTGFLIGIPLYYNAGFVILLPLIFTVAKKTKLPVLYIAIPVLASLSTTHCFLPPHPGPVFLVNAFKANMGKTFIYGAIIAIPVVILAGPVLGRLLQGIKVDIGSFFTDEKIDGKVLPATLPSFIIGLLPVLLITTATAVDYFLPDGNVVKKVVLFIGDPTIALLIAVISAAWYFGWRSGKTVHDTMKWLSDAITGIAMILLIITTGGVFKQVLIDSGAGTYIASFSSQWNLPPLLFAWIVTALLRVTIGSATVAAITAAGVVAPLMTEGTVSPELMVLAIGTGSVFGSHINDSAFWMYKEFFNLSLKQTFFSWTLMESTISVLGFGAVLLLQLFV